MSLVLDASITLGWILKCPSERERDLADRVLASLVEREDPLVPWVWHLEVIHALARAAALSSSDASYLELALRSGSRLATFDRALAAAAAGAGVDLFQ